MNGLSSREPLLRSVTLFDQISLNIVINILNNFVELKFLFLFSLIVALALHFNTFFLQKTYFKELAKTKPALAHVLLGTNGKSNNAYVIHLHINQLTRVF